MRHTFLLILAAAGALIASPLAAQKMNFDFNGEIADGAEIFSSEFENQMNLRLEKIEARTQVSVLILTIADLEGVDSVEIAKTVGELMQESGKIQNHWVVFILAPTDREFSGAISTPVKVPEGKTVQDMVTDPEKQRMAEEVAQTFGDAVTSTFKQGRWEDGMRAGIDALETRLSAVEPDQVIEQETEETLPI